MLDSILSWLCILSMVLLAVFVMTAVVMRYFFGHSIMQLEELITIFFVIITFFGTAICVRENSHINIPIFIDTLPIHSQKFFCVISSLTGIFVSVITILVSWKWISTVGNTRSVTLNVPCMYYYLIVPISFIFVIFYLIINIFSVFIKIPEPKKGYLSDIDIVNLTTRDPSLPPQDGQVSHEPVSRGEK